MPVATRSRSPRLHLPHDEEVAWRKIAHPGPGAIRTDRQGPEIPSGATAPGIVRWRWYTPATALLIGILIGAVTFVAWGSRTDDGDGDSNDAPVAVTAPAELRTLGTRALALVSYPWHDLGYEIVFAPGQRDVRAQTDIVAHRITVFLSRGDASHRVAHDIAHELGHAYDQRYLTDADRAAYLTARGKPRATWFPGSNFSDYRFGAGDFAEVFAACHAASPDFRSQLAPKPAQPCSLIPPTTKPST